MKCIPLQSSHERSLQSNQAPHLSDQGRVDEVRRSTGAGIPPSDTNVLPHGDLVAAWLNGEDHIIEVSGPPSWSSLIAALRDINQPGIADGMTELLL